MTKRRRWAFYAVLILVIGIFLILFLPVIVVRTNYAYICEHTGSRKGHTQWWSGNKTDEWYKTSAVETFIREKFPDQLQQQWTSYAGTGHNIYGSKILFGHGRPGPILQVPIDWLNQWFESLSEAEKKAFYELLLSEDKTAIQLRINDIYDYLIERNAE